MRPKTLNQDQSNLFTARLSQQLDPKHELLQLAKQIPWESLEKDFQPLFSEGPSRPPLPVRLAVGLMILQHLYDYSDERVVQVWIENPYWQAFCGYDFLQWELPVHPTSLTRWRNRIGTSGMEKILQLSIRVAVDTKTVNPKELEEVICDTTVMPKAIAYPVDGKLVQRSIERIVRAATAAKIPLKRTFVRVSRKALFQVKRLMHAKRFRKAQRPLKKLRKYLEKLLQDIDPHLETCSKVLREAVVGAKLLIQSREDKNKIYSCHEPLVSCIAKGKAHKPYEFGAKTCIVVTKKKGLALAMTTHVGNPYDGHLLEEAISKAELESGRKVQQVLLDKGYRGHGMEGIQVLISGRRGLPPHLKKTLKRRSAIEPWIGHMKHDGKLDRCYLKGPVGDQIHALLVGIAHNFRTILRKLRLFCACFLTRVFCWVRFGKSNTSHYLMSEFLPI